MLKNLFETKHGLERAGLADDIAGNKQLFNYILAIGNKHIQEIKEGVYFTVKFKGPKSNVTLRTGWKILPGGRLYLRTIQIF